MQLKTLMGLTITEMRTQLNAEFPPHAYKPVPGGAQLTDIDPAYMRHCLNDVFGLCGVGWGYTFNPDAIQVSTTGKRGVSALLLDFTFWYKLVDATGDVHTYTLPATGGSDNHSAVYAVKGAITSALGHAASNLGFQEAVYMGQRSHKTVGQRTAQPATASASATTSTPKSTPAPTRQHPATAAAPGGSNGKGMTLAQAHALKLPFGTRSHPDYKGQALAALENRDPGFIAWLSHNAPQATIKQAAGLIVSARATHTH